MDRFAHALVGSAAADIARHRRVDVVVARIGLLREQGHRRHDLARLAVAALHDVGLGPGLLHHVQAVGGDAFDRRDRTRADGADRRDARANRVAVEMYGARSTLRHATAELGAHQAEQIAEHPQERHARIRIRLLHPFVHFYIYADASALDGRPSKTLSWRTRRAG